MWCLRTLILNYYLPGKQGQTITQLQKDSGAVIKLSKAKDFYPGERDFCDFNATWLVNYFFQVLQNESD